MKLNPNPFALRRRHLFRRRLEARDLGTVPLKLLAFGLTRMRLVILLGRRGTVLPLRSTPPVRAGSAGVSPAGVAKRACNGGSTRCCRAVVCDVSGTQGIPNAQAGDGSRGNRGTESAHADTM